MSSERHHTESRIFTHDRYTTFTQPLSFVPTGFFPVKHRNIMFHNKQAIIFVRRDKVESENSTASSVIHNDHEAFDTHLSSNIYLFCIRELVRDGGATHKHPCHETSPSQRTSSVPLPIPTYVPTRLGTSRRGMSISSSTTRVTN